MSMGAVVELEELTPTRRTRRVAISDVDINRCQAISYPDPPSVVVPLKLVATRIAHWPRPMMPRDRIPGGGGSTAEMPFIGGLAQTGTHHPIVRMTISAFFVD
jgi:hypothetical protein